MTEAAASPDQAPAALDHDGTFRVGYLGPAGTFTEQALSTQTDLLDAELVAIGSIPDVLAATEAGNVDLGFVAIENSIEGTVNVTQDTLAFEAHLLIQREVVIPVHLNLLGRPGARLDEIKAVVSFPHATAQCRGFLTERLPGVVAQAANSTSEAARLVAEGGDPHTAALSTARAAEVYGLEILAADIEDHPDNATRFVVVARQGVPSPTGHDKTSIVVFQRADAPGSLLAILQEFAARNINLSKLESRPTKKGLGDYCFLIDLEGHIDDEVVGDALRTLVAKQHDVKYLGSYPAAGEHGPEVRREAVEAWRTADAWLHDLRAQVRR
ncbi:MAG: prephenate dehydratase [Acidimicrobiales bacterium]